MRQITRTSRRIAMIILAVNVFFLLSSPVSAQSKQAAASDSLSGIYFAHDLYEIFSDTQTLGRGFRTFNANGIMARLFTFPASTPLDFEIKSDATWRVFTDTFNSGFNGTVGLGGDLAVLSLEAAANADAQVRDGYASLQVSVKQGAGMDDGDFNGNYSYHALLRTSSGAYRASFGLATTSGKGSMVLIREAAVGRTFSYGVESDGRIALVKQDSANAAIVAGGALVVNTADVGSGDDAEISGGYTGLALYLRRFTNADPATLADFRGTYRIHRIAANGSATPAADAGAVTAGGNGYYFGQLGGQPYEGQLALNASGTFTRKGSTAIQGTLGAGGDVAIITSVGGSNPFLEIWVRTAGGSGNSIDGDGDGLTDDEEDTLGTDPEDADSDNDGLLDNADDNPTTADNVVDAALSRNNITVSAGDPAITNVTLTLDSNDFPFFEWEVSSNADWVTFEPAAGVGDDTINLNIDVPSLEAADTPHVATINIDAPDMVDTAPLSLSVTVTSTQVDLALTPESLNFTVIEGGAKASATVRVSSPDANVFPWSATTEFPWISVTPRTGTAAGDVTIEVDPADLLADQSPYAGTVIFKPGGIGPKQKALTVSARVLPERDVDVPFEVAPSDTAQSLPSVAFDGVTGTWIMAWVEGEQIRGALFDEQLIPLTSPVQLSLTGLGTATHPSVVALSGEGEAWVVWEQHTTGTEDGLLQAKAFNLTTHSVGNAFGFSSGSGSKTRPQAVYNATLNEVAITYEQEVTNARFAGLVRVNGASRGVISSGFASPGSGPQTAPSIAWLADDNTYLLAWREDITTDQTTTSLVQAARFSGDSGALLGEVLSLDSNAPSAANIAVSASTGLNRWIITWSDGTSTLNTATLDGAGTVSGPRIFDGAQQAETPVALGYNSASKQAILLWSREPVAGARAAVYRTAAGNGQALGSLTQLPDNPSTVNSAAAGANSLANEFLLIWEDPDSIPRQLRALRLAGGTDDVDEDGLPNDWELQYGLDPASAAGENGAAGDPDQDALTNLAEYTLGTDPTNSDSDGDGLLDGQEDRNSDGVIGTGDTSPLSIDSDEDGVRDDVEWFLSSDGSDNTKQPVSGIYRITSAPWQSGQTGELSVSFYVADPGSYALSLNAGLEAPESWAIASADDGSPHTYEAGVHTIVYTITPGENLTPTTAYASLHFLLSGNGVSSERTHIAVVDLHDTLPSTDSLSAESLARTFAPVLRLHHDAIFSPMPVEISLNAGTLDLGNGITRIHEPRAFDPGQSTHEEAFIDLPGTDTNALFAAYPDGEALPDPVLYYTVTRLDSTSVEAGANPAHISIQYYLHFFADVWGLDQQGGHRHEGDWEVFEVLLDENGIPYRAALTQQWQRARLDGGNPGGEAREWADVETASDTHPVIYVGQGGNSLYFAPGSTRYGTATEVHDGLGAWLLPDGTEDADYATRLPLMLAPLGRLHEPNVVPWLPFAGTWGQSDFPQTASDSTTPSVNDGPVGPAFLGTTLDPTNADGVLHLWSDPYAFAQRMPSPPQGLTTQVRGTVPEAFWGKTVMLLDARGRVFSGTATVGNGAFDITSSLLPCLLAVVDVDPFGRPVPVASVRFTPGAKSTPILLTQPDITPLGALELDNSFLTGEGNFALLDSDGDSTPDATDNDMDGDGINNADDLDVQGDGWDDTFQAQDPDSDGIPSFVDGDDDGDGRPDAQDADRDGSGTPDNLEPADVDGDGFIDALDLDMDNDGFDNATEQAAGSDPRHYLDTPSSKVGDIDQDGEVDAADGQRLINLGLGRGAYTPRADYNLNGFIDAVDLQSLINEILAGKNQG